MQTQHMMQSQLQNDALRDSQANDGYGGNRKFRQRDSMDNLSGWSKKLEEANDSTLRERQMKMQSEQDRAGSNLNNPFVYDHDLVLGQSNDSQFYNSLPTDGHRNAVVGFKQY